MYTESYYILPFKKTKESLKGYYFLTRSANLTATKGGTPLYIFILHASFQQGSLIQSIVQLILF